MLDERWAEGVVSRVPQLARGLTWCITCGREQEVNAAWRLRNGWPMCCGATMTIDSPEERAAFARQPEVTDGTETLGARILDAANAYAAAISEQVVALDRGTWEVAHADAVTEAMDRLRALAARADAAERLAGARVALDDISADLREAAFYDTATKALVKRRRAAEAEDAEALAAWRALGEVQS